MDGCGKRGWLRDEKAGLGEEEGRRGVDVGEGGKGFMWVRRERGGWMREERDGVGVEERVDAREGEERSECGREGGVWREGWEERCDVGEGGGGWDGRRERGGKCLVVLQPQNRQRLGRSGRMVRLEVGVAGRSDMHYIQGGCVREQ